jgi:hypothetical protein
MGYFRNIDHANWKELISWTYYSDDEKQVLVIEQWGEDDFEASLGLVVPPNQITNILPSA